MLGLKILVVRKKLLSKKESYNRLLSFRLKTNLFVARSIHMRNKNNLLIKKYN
jgi:hypothetical protein